MKFLSSFSVLAVVSLVSGYIPAAPSNDTSSLVDSDDLIHLAWEPNGVFSAVLSRQLTANQTVVDDYQGLINTSTLGVLVHFSEAETSQPPSLVPWIAMISCDSNGTSYSMEDDIFTLARDRGALAALLYSNVSAGCIMNADYLSPSFDKVMDVYATRDVYNARLIESQFTVAGVDSAAYSFNSAMLNTSETNVAALLAQGSLVVVGGDVTETSSATPVSTVMSTSTTDSGELSVTATSTDDSSASSSTDAGSSSSATPGPTQRVRRQATSTASSAAAAATTRVVNYLGAVLAAKNLTVGVSNSTTSTTSTSTSNNNSGPNTGLAMIILYAITGVVTFMFLIVILSGAIRAIRHPERYGPRANIGPGHGRGQPQSRAGGLTRAILDTFPVVKFGRTEQDAADDEAERRAREGDLESGKPVELSEVPTNATVAKAHVPTTATERRGSGGSSTSFVSAPEVAATEGAAEGGAEGGAEAAPAPLAGVNPADVDHEATCPICVCDFEEGEDVRVLPCDRRHRFHPECIDPYLLSFSSLCPLCRLDLSVGKEAEELPEEEADAIGEQQVISNLRAMLQGSRGSTSGAGGATANQGGATGRNRFFRYVANRRRQAGTTATTPPEGEASTSGDAPAATTGRTRRNTRGLSFSIH
ncbi:hypothetical protein MNV49_003898 [Pseudohyphozyma bogoriensis]|nr:hypothetical protein MNV49_003898 [Pseudohyphozyma bogoriensis]